MRRTEEAKRMLDMAFKDIKALKGMHDVETFDETIFGFHVQQAIEKVIKSWLTYLNKEYPKTHDISLLLNLLEEQGMRLFRLVGFSRVQCLCRSISL